MIVNKEKNFISAVLYTHNDDYVIKATLEKIHAILSDNFSYFEIICVNDASTDNSRNEIEAFSSEHSTIPISVINMSSYHGTELSMDAGVDLAIGDFVYEFDNPFLDYNTNLIMDIYHKALEGYDIVSASPTDSVHGASKFFYKIYNKYNYSNSTIQHESFRLLSRRAINRVKSLNRTIIFRKAVYANCGLKTTTVNYQSHNQHPQKYEQNEFSKRRELAIDSLIIFTNAIQQISFFISLFFLAFTVFIGIYALLSYMGQFHTLQLARGWTSLMLFLSIGFFGIFLILSIILKYLSVILKLIYKKKYYLIESVEKLTSN